jgi:hypothetical protein
MNDEARADNLPGLRFLSLGIYHFHQLASTLSARLVFPGDGPDGGGIRGVSILTILREIMMRIKHDLDESGESTKTGEMPLPCDYFDLIGGTSTGGSVI